MTIRLHKGDLPDLSRYTTSVAIDTETLGLNLQRDRLCVVQLSPGDGTADVVQIARGQTSAPNLMRLLADPKVTKIFHFGRFDIAMLHRAFGVEVAPVFCTKIASKLCRTYTDRHGLKDLVRELLGVDLSKQQQSSDWAAKSSPKRSWLMPPPMFCICINCARSCNSCWRARAVLTWRRHVLTFCRSVRGLI